MLGRSRLGLAISFLCAAFLLAPLIAIVPYSFTSRRYLSMPQSELSLRHYESLFTRPEWLSAIGDSLLVAALSATLVTALAASFALGLWFRRPAWAKALVGLALMPLIVPPVTSAVVLFFLLARLGLLDSVPGLVIGHTVMVLPVAVMVMLSALARLDRDLDRAARGLGASFGQTVLWVILPNLKFALGGAWFLSLVMSWEESAVSLFVAGVEVQTLPKKIWESLRLDVDPAVAAISVLMIAATALVVLFRRQDE